MSTVVTSNERASWRITAAFGNSTRALRRLVVAAIAALSIAGAVIPASADASLYNCGTKWINSVRAAGWCSGSGNWQLAISCTWGYSGKTGWIWSNSWSYTEKQCGIGSLRSAWIELQ
jgi:hypothetical protein